MKMHDKLRKEYRRVKEEIEVMVRTQGSERRVTVTENTVKDLTIDAIKKLEVFFRKRRHLNIIADTLERIAWENREDRGGMCV
ncbi:MAG: hypothetical protein WCW56_03490 [Candidatus Paceibacterota bacterium]|jgi:hypothetical protein